MNYIVLRRGNGSVRLLVPNTNAAVIRSSLKMYYPSRVLGYAYKYVQYLFLPSLAKLGLVEKFDTVNDYCPHLNKILNHGENQEYKVAALLVADDSTRSKSTLKIMNLMGHDLAYARAAMLDKARQVVQHETEVLNHLLTIDIKGSVPTVLSFGEYDSPAITYSIQSVGPNKGYGNSLSTPHLQFLDSMQKSEVVHFYDIKNELKNKLNSLDLPKTVSKHLDKVFIYLDSTDDFVINRAIEHGDFAPWNIRKDNNSKVFVFDWEYSDLNGLIWMDIMHFTYQLEKLVNRKDDEVIKDSLLNIFDLEVYGQAGLHYNAATKQALVILYFLKMIVIAYQDCTTDCSAHQPKLNMIGLMLNMDLSDE